VPSQHVLIVVIASVRILYGFFRGDVFYCVEHRD